MEIMAFHRLWTIDRPKTPKIITCDLYLTYVHSQINSQTWTKVGANRSSCLAAFPDLNLWHHKPPWNAPWGIEGRIIFSLCPFPDESADVYQMWCQSVQPFYRFPRILNWWPPNPPGMPSGVLRCELYLAYVHSQTNPQTCTNCCAIQCSRLTASPDFWICDPLTPPPPPPHCILGILRGDLYLTYVHSQINSQTWTKVGATRYSRLTASPYIYMLNNN